MTVNLWLGTTLIMMVSYGVKTSEYCSAMFHLRLRKTWGPASR